MRDTILRSMEPVTRRFRQLRWWRLVTVVALIAALVGWLMLDRVHAGTLDGRDASLFLLAGTLMGVFAVWAHVRFSFHNRRTIARQIERTFPALQQRLLTCLGSSEAGDDEGPDESPGYLERRLIKETQDHARSHRWADTVPPGKLFWSRISGLVATGGLVVILTMLALASPTVPGDSASRLPQRDEIVVEPGNTTVERGTSLVVTAEFSERVPGEAELVCLSDDGGERRIAMKRNLNDPVLGAYLASVDRPLRYRVQTNARQSEFYSVEVFDYPALVRSDAELHYPDYTGREPGRIEDTVRVAAVEGSKLTWTLFLNKPVASAELVDESGSGIALEADPSRAATVAGSFDLDETRRWTLKLVDAEGRENKFPPELFARVLPNTPPELELSAATDVRVSPLEEFPVAARVGDDFGVRRVGLTYSFGDQPTQEIELASDLGGGDEATVEHLFAMESLEAEPDQLLSYYVWAEDVGPDGETRRTQSDLYFAEVRPFEEIFRQGQQPPGGASSQQQQGQSQSGQRAEQLAELQKQIINATWNVIRRENGGETGESFADDVNVIRQSQQNASQQLAELSQNLRDQESLAHVVTVTEHMSDAIESLTAAAESDSAERLDTALVAERASYQGLLKLRAREFEVSRQQQQRGGQPGGSASGRQRQQQLEDLELDNEQDRYETQQQAESNEENDGDREMRQVLNRLRELARRQEDLNEQLAELQSALQQAETEEERKEIERRLKRLREQQQDLLRETDELSERMQSPENRNEMRESSEQLSRTREKVRQASEALEKNDASGALSAGTRAEREFEQMRDEFRRRSAGEFSEEVREMREAAQELDERQQALGEQLRSTEQEDQAGLRGGSRREQLAERLGQQRQRLSELMDQIRSTVEQAESSEPLLAEELYDAFRKTQQAEVEQRLQQTSELLQQGFDSQAGQQESEAGEGITRLREQLESAAESVLGDETESLKRALGELEQLTRNLDGEIRKNTESTETDSESGRSGSGSPGEVERSEAESRRRQANEAGRESQSAEQSQSAGQSQSAEQSQSGQPGGQSQQGSGSAGRSAGQDTSATPGVERQQANRGERPESGLRNGGGASGGRGGGSLDWGRGITRLLSDEVTTDPLTGAGFREWSDRLRDVEEMVSDAELRSQAARIRDRAREVRRNLKRHSEQPQWPLIEEMIAEPLRELKRDVAEELLRRSADRNSNVPIDRDPVPPQFSEAVRRYYENLGSGR